MDGCVVVNVVRLEKATAGAGVMRELWVPPPVETEMMVACPCCGRAVVVWMVGGKSRNRADRRRRLPPR